MGLQDAGADGAYAVEEHLQDEDPEEKHRETLDSSTSARERLSADCQLVVSPTSGPANTMPTSERTAISGSTSGEQGVRQAPGVLLAVRRDPVHQHRDKDRVEYPAHEQLVDQARQQDRGRVGVGHQPTSEDGGLGHPPPVPRHPREHGRHGDRELWTSACAGIAPPLLSTLRPSAPLSARCGLRPPLVSTLRLAPSLSARRLPPVGALSGSRLGASP